MSNDLFDLVYSIFVNNDIAVDNTTIVTTFLRKTIFEPSPQAALGLLLAVPFEIMRGYWNKIVCVAESRMDFTTAVDRFKGDPPAAPVFGAQHAHAHKPATGCAAPNASANSTGPAHPRSPVPWAAGLPYLTDNPGAQV